MRALDSLGTSHRLSAEHTPSLRLCLPCSCLSHRGSSTGGITQQALAGLLAWTACFPLVPRGSDYSALNASACLILMSGENVFQLSTGEAERQCRVNNQQSD